jgi:hypothetical protein
MVTARLGVEDEISSRGRAGSNGRSVACRFVMFSRRRPDVLVLASSVALTRFLFRSHYLYDLDSVNFGLGMGRFDPRVHQPHPPGYFLYVYLGRALNLLIHNANLALVLLSILASCGCAIVIYNLALRWFGLAPARFAGAMFLFSPLAWFHGTVALTYSLEAFFSSLMALLCWGIACGKKAWILPTAIVLGLAAGIRPSSLLFLAPLFLFSMRRAGLKRASLAAIALAATTVAWFVPMLWASGGISRYFGALLSLWRMVPSRDTVFNSSPATSMARAATVAFIYLLCFGTASLVPLLKRPGTPEFRKERLFTAVWVAPALSFFVFVFLKFVNSGYLMILLPAGCIWLGYWLAEWYQRSALRQAAKIGILGAGALANTAMFLWSPLYCSYASVRRFEAQLDAVRRALPKAGPPGDTLLVAFDSHFLGFRHAGYYLPAYTVVEYPQAKLTEGPRIFAMQDRDTRLLVTLPQGHFARFVLFPLPGSGGEYANYLKKVTARVPAASLRTVRIDRDVFVSGPMADLPLLFPGAQPPASPYPVYPALHSAEVSVNTSEHPLPR